MPSFGFGGGGGGGGAHAGIDLGAIRNFFGGNDLENWWKSDEAKALLMEGLNDLQTGASPDKLIRWSHEAVNRGANPKKLDDLISTMNGHFEQIRQEQERRRITSELEPSIKTTDTPTRPNFTPLAGNLGGGLENFEDDLTLPFSVKEQPGRELRQADLLRLAPREAFKSLAGGANLMRSPSMMRENEAGADAALALRDERKTKENIMRLEELDMQDIPDEADESYRPSPRAMARSKGALRDFLPARAKPADPLLEEKRGELQSRTQRNRAQAARAGRPSQDGGVSETITERRIDPLRVEETQQFIAKAARDRGVGQLPIERQANAIIEIADDLGFEIQGTPELDAPLSGGFGFGKPPPAQLKGQFRLKQKPEVSRTTRGRPGAPGEQPTRRPPAAPPGGGSALDRVKNKFNLY